MRYAFKVDDRLMACGPFENAEDAMAHIKRQNPNATSIEPAELPEPAVIAPVAFEGPANVSPKNK